MNSDLRFLDMATCSLEQLEMEIKIMEARLNAMKEILNLRIKLEAMKKDAIH